MASPRPTSPNMAPRQIFGVLHHLKRKSSSSSSSSRSPSSSISKSLSSSSEIMQSFEIDTDSILIGRDEHCDVRIHALDVSREHAQIEIDLLAGHATLTVLGRSGVKLNKVHLLKQGVTHVLQNGDVISVANRKFRFNYPPGLASGVDWEQELEGDGSGIGHGKWGFGVPDIAASPMPFSRSSKSGLDGNNTISSRTPSKMATTMSSTPRKGEQPTTPASRRYNVGAGGASRRMSTASTRMHLFPATAASQEIKDVIASLASPSKLTSNTAAGSPMKPSALNASPHKSSSSSARMSPAGSRFKLPASPFKKPGQPPPSPMKMGLTSGSGQKQQEDDLIYLERLDEEEEGSEEGAFAEEQVGQAAQSTRREYEYAQNGNEVQKDSKDVFRRQQGPLFQTPQPPARALRAPRTSLAPRTRKDIDAVAEATGTTEESEYTGSSHHASESAGSPQVSEQEEDEDVEMRDETPSASSASFDYSPPSPSPNQVSQSQAPPPATPRNLGSVSLRRQLLLRSTAKKVMEQQVSQRQQANVPTSTPRRQAYNTALVTAPTPSKIELPSPGGTDYGFNDESEKSKELEEDVPAYETDYVDGQSEEELEDEEEVDDEDLSEGSSNGVKKQATERDAAIHASPHNDSASLSPSMRRRAASEIQNAASDDDVEDQVQHLDERPSEEEQEDVDNSLSMDQDDEIEEDAKMGHVEPPAMLGTPMASRPIAPRFYTPQAQQTRPDGPVRFKTGRKSLSEIFGPPVRFKRTPIKQEKQEEVEHVARRMEQSLHVEKPLEVITRRRPSVAPSSRRLPEPPVEGFHSLPAPKTSPTKTSLFAPTIPADHPALAIHEISSEEEDVAPGTPVNQFRQKLKAMRRESLHRQSVGGSMAQASPRRGFVALIPPHTPNFSGLRDMLKEPRIAPKTPSFVGMKQLLKEPEPSPATPEMSDLRHLHHVPQHAVPATPAMQTLKHMFAANKAYQATPQMQGVEDMYAVEEEEQEEESVEEEVLQPVAVPARSRATTSKATSSTASKSAPVSKLPARRARTAVGPAEPVSRTTQSRQISAEPVVAASDRSRNTEIEAPAKTAPGSRISRAKAIPAPRIGTTTATAATRKPVVRKAVQEPVTASKESADVAPKPTRTTGIRSATSSTAARATRTRRATTPLEENDAPPQPIEMAKPKAPAVRARPTQRKEMIAFEEEQGEEQEESEVIEAAIAPKPKAKATRTATVTKAGAAKPSAATAASKVPTAAKPTATRATRTARTATTKAEGKVEESTAEVAVPVKRVTRSRK